MIVWYFHNNNSLAFQRVIERLVDNHARGTFSQFDLRLRNRLAIYNVRIRYAYNIVSD
jgi:hypothetical protein